MRQNGCSGVYVFLLTWRAYIRRKDLDSGKQEHISHFVLSFCASFLYYAKKKKKNHLRLHETMGHMSLIYFAPLDFWAFFRLQFSFSRTKQFNAPIKLSFLAPGLVVFHMHAFSFAGAAYPVLCFLMSPWNGLTSSVSFQHSRIFQLKHEVEEGHIEDILKRQWGFVTLQT